MEMPDGNEAKNTFSGHAFVFKDLTAGVAACLTEKILTELLSSTPQINLALRLVMRSSSIRGGFTNNTYGWNSDVHRR